MKLLNLISILSFFLFFDSVLVARSADVRAVYIDFRTQVMNLDAMKELAWRASDDGMNAIVVEWEATFPFKENFILRNGYAFSETEVREFIRYCDSIGIEVIPLQNCFGHSEYILRHDRYAALKEDKKDCSQVCPLKIGLAQETFRSIFGEIASMHASEYIHIGCDETRLLGHCQECRKAVSDTGISKLYVDYVSAMCRIVSDLGKTPMIWADIILKHPEALDSLPENVIIVDWNYGWSPDYFGDMEKLLGSGHEIWGACSLRSHPDNLYLVQWRKHLDNIFDYTAWASLHGLEGIVNTSWSTSGTYGYIYDDNNEVIDLQPVREVYPQSGFDMLEKAFAAAVSGEHADAGMFLDSYCRKNLGLSREKDVAVVKDYFNMPQIPVYSMPDGVGPVKAELQKCADMRSRLSGVKFPVQAKEISSHLKLMLDIRINYLEFKLLERQLEDSGFDRPAIAGASHCLSDIISECDKLRKKFMALNSSLLKDPQQSYGEWTYHGKMKNLSEILENIVNE